MGIFLFLCFCGFIGWALWSATQWEKRQEVRAKAFLQLCRQLEDSPLSEQLHANLLATTEGSSERAQKAYQLALSILADHPDSLSAKQFALTAGRKSYSAERPDKTPTIYDEQAIQNDIMIRTGGSAAPQPEPVKV